MTAINPAAKAVSALSEYCAENSQLHCIETPVDSQALYRWIENTLQQYSPDIWIGVGVAVGSPAIRLEHIGINVRCFDVPDIQGKKLKPTAIFDGGPVAYQSSLNNRAIVEQLRASGIPAVESFHAGTHLCNQMLYTVRYFTESKNLNLISGFIHVPQSTDNVAELASDGGLCSSMSIEMMSQAIRIAVDCADQQYSEAAVHT